jgi:hypothetical protein
MHRSPRLILQPWSIALTAGTMMKSEGFVDIESAAAGSPIQLRQLSDSKDPIKSHRQVQISELAFLDLGYQIPMPNLIKQRKPKKASAKTQAAPVANGSAQAAGGSAAAPAAAAATADATTVSAVETSTAAPASKHPKLTILHKVSCAAQNGLRMHIALGRGNHLIVCMTVRVSNAVYSFC